MDWRLSALITEMAAIAKPPPKRAAWAWAEAHRILPKSNAEPGPYRVRRTPWVIDFTEAVADYRYHEVIAVTGSQVAKTDGILLNVIGWKMMDNPTPTLLYMPTEKSAKSISKDRLSKMFDSVPELSDAINRKTETVFEKFIHGVRFGLGWGGSATEVASHPAGLVGFDELDRIDDIPGEGSPYELAKVRGSSYPNFTMVGTSTPTLGKVDDERHPETGLIHWRVSDNIQSLSWSLWQDGTRHEYMLPCPHCDEYFTPKRKLLYYPENATPIEAEQQAGLICPHCGTFIDANKQFGMIQRGRMVAPGQWVENGEVQGQPPPGRVYSGYVNGLCSPWEPWGNRASELVRAERSGKSGRIQSIINTRFGELYSLSGESPDWQQVRKLAGGHQRGQMPTWVGLLSLGVDVQKNRLVWVLCGWGLHDGELDCAVIEYGEVFAQIDTSHPEVWARFRAEVLLAHAIKVAGIDTAYNPSKQPGQEQADGDQQKNRNIIYQFCRNNRKALAVRGSPQPMIKNYQRSLIDTDVRGRPQAVGLALWTLDTDTYKTEVYTAINRALEEDERGRYASLPGSLHLPENVCDDFLRQLTAEERVMQDGKISWVKNHRDNHYLDAMMINYFLADMRKFRHLLRQQQPAPAPQPEPQVTYAAPEPETPASPEPDLSEGQFDDYAGVGDDWDI